MDTMELEKVPAKIVVSSVWTEFVTSIKSFLEWRGLYICVFIVGKSSSMFLSSYRVSEREAFSNFLPDEMNISHSDAITEN